MRRTKKKKEKSLGRLLAVCVRACSQSRKNTSLEHNEVNESNIVRRRAWPGLSVGAICQLTLGPRAGPSKINDGALRPAQGRIGSSALVQE